MYFFRWLKQRRANVRLPCLDFSGSIRIRISGAWRRSDSYSACLRRIALLMRCPIATRLEAEFPSDPDVLYQSARLHGRGCPVRPQLARRRRAAHRRPRARGRRDRCRARLPGAAHRRGARGRDGLARARGGDPLQPGRAAAAVDAGHQRDRLGPGLGHVLPHRVLDHGGRVVVTGVSHVVSQTQGGIYLAAWRRSSQASPCSCSAAGTSATRGPVEIVGPARERRCAPTISGRTHDLVA